MSRRRGDERHARETLSQVEAPDEHRAEERARQVVVSAFEERQPERVSARGIGARVALALLAVAAIAGFVLTPAGAEVGDWIADRVESGEDDAQRRVSALPTSGAVLVESSDGVWILREDGSKRRLGNFDEATWSPNGLFVAVTRGSELRAVDPTGGFRWSIEAANSIYGLDWSTDEGFRVAFAANGGVHVVTGDGVSSNREASARAGGPVWRPESDPDAALHFLTYVDQQNRVVTLATDSDRVVWRTAPLREPVASLEWSASGERLLVSGPESSRVLSSDGELLTQIPLSGIYGPRPAISPDGRSVAVIDLGPKNTSLELIGVDDRSRKRLYATHRDRSAEARFTGLGSPVFSPDGEWILVPWPAADQWLFVNAESRRVTAVADITRQFDSDGKLSEDFPEVAGWCC